MGRDKLLGPGFDGSFDTFLAVNPPGLCDDGDVDEAEEVEVNDKALDVLFGCFLRVEGVGDDWELGCVDGLACGVAEEVECEGQEAGEVVALFDRVDVVILDLVGLEALVKYTLSPDSTYGGLEMIE